MADDNCLVELMAELLAEARETKAITFRTAEDSSEFKSPIAKNNAAVGEIRLSVMRFTERIEDIYHLDQRVRVLESIVLPKPPPLQAA
ncbi:MAG: hypothetical protein EOO56_23070 [Hymenobacter sp.]|nr:MAG: hypothetical protein EOO56_23070 [Hymenobacter sp.]